GQPNPIDRDLPVTEASRLVRPQGEARQEPGRPDYRQRPIADRRLADADELGAGAEIEAALKNRLDVCGSAAPAELACQTPRPQQRNDDVRVVQRRCPHPPSTPIAASATCALDSKTRTPAAASLLTCSSRGCGSASVPVTDARISGPPARAAR